MALIRAKQIGDLATKLPVRAVSLVALAAGGTPVYANGTGGSGATYTAAANSAIDGIDGVTLAVGDAVLLTAENANNAAYNGIYTLTTLGTGAAKWVLTRRSDADTNVKTFGGISVMSTSDGAANGGKWWILNNTSASLTIGTTAQTWILDTSDGSTPQYSNLHMAASATTGDNQLACATGVVTTPKGDISVYVNGALQDLGNAVKTNSCYFAASGGGGATARAFGAIVATDQLYWVQSVAGFSLATTDFVDFKYNT